VQSAEYEESDVNRIYTKFDLSLQAVLNADYSKALGVPADISGPAAIMNYIRQTLLKQRQKLVVSCAGVQINPTVQMGLMGTVDAKNGPQPQHCKIIQLTNTTFLIDYRIIAHYWENNPNGGPNLPANTVLSNRWSETVDMDDCQYSTRTREGTYIIRSDNVSLVTVDQVRPAMAMLGVPAGFLRVMSQYRADPDGLRLAWRVVDKEQFKMPPTPAFRARGSYTESYPKYGYVRYGEVNLNLKGDKATNQYTLLKTAVGIAYAKLNMKTQNGQVLFNGQQLLKGLPDEGSIRVNMYENEVEVRLRSRLANRQKDGRKSNMAGINFQDICYTPGSTGNPTQPAYKLNGTAGILLQAAAYWDPNVSNSLVAATGQLKTGKQVGQAGNGE
jgi:hypothetical protein